MNKTFMWCLVNGVMLFLLIAGFFYEVTGAYNLVVALVVINAVGSCAFLSSDVCERLKVKGRSVPAWVEGVFDAAFLLVLAWFGSFVLFVLYLFSCLLQAQGWAQADLLSDKAKG